VLVVAVEGSVVFVVVDKAVWWYACSSSVARYTYMLLMSLLYVLSCNLGSVYNQLTGLAYFWFLHIVWWFN